VADSSKEESLEQIDQVNGQGPLYEFLYPSKELLPDDKEMTLFDHLEELRQRLFVSVLAVGAAIVGCFAFSKELIMILEAPVKVQGVRFLQLAPGEFFFTTLKVRLNETYFLALTLKRVLFLKTCIIGFKSTCVCA
jgi:sec-independent protein translocase protein TatC